MNNNYNSIEMILKPWIEMNLNLNRTILKFNEKIYK